MTRVCMDCKAVLGEKCPYCGGCLVVKSILFPGCFLCAACGSDPNKKKFRFAKGEGGETHGLCEPCADIRRREMDGAAAVRA